MNSALDQLEVGMQNYKATMEQLKASLANVDSNGNVAAPISGTILSLSAVENGFVSPSAPVATIDSTTDMEVKVGGIGVSDWEASGGRKSLGLH